MWPSLISQKQHDNSKYDTTSATWWGMFALQVPRMPGNGMPPPSRLCSSTWPTSASRNHGCSSLDTKYMIESCISTSVTKHTYVVMQHTVMQKVTYKLILFQMSQSSENTCLDKHKTHQMITCSKIIYVKLYTSNLLNQQATCTGNLL